MKMLPRPRRVWLTGLGVLSACASHVEQSRPPAAPVETSAPQAWSFETEWRRAAVESAPGSPAAAWELDANPTTERAYGTAFDSCVPQHDSGGQGDASRQRFVLDIAQDGSVRQVWSESESPLAACVRESLGRTQYAPAPYDGYRLGLILDLDDAIDLSETSILAQLPRLPRPAPGPITSYDATRTAIRDMGTLEGQTYMEMLTSTFGELFSSGLMKCMTIPPLESERSLRGYSLIIEIAADGASRRLLVEPNPETPASEPLQSPRADCLHDVFDHARLAAPPWDGFWVQMGLDNPPPGFPTK